MQQGKNVQVDAWLALLMLVALCPPAAQADDPAKLTVGVARVDITPELPIRLTGYGNRREEATEIAQPLWGKALAFGADGEHPTVLITTDLIGVGESLVDWLAEQLGPHGVDRQRLVVCATHTHTGPVVDGLLPYLFHEPIPADHQQRIEAYAQALRPKLLKLALDALADRRPALVDWTQGQLRFAANRRVLADGKWTGFGVTEGAPVDHAFPLLRVRAADGRLRALLMNYACHGTTYGGNFNQVHGDWPGEAQQLLEAEYPGVTVMVALGCGADANPEPRGETAHVAAHGKAVAEEVARLLGGDFTPLVTRPEARLERVMLPLEPLPDMQVWRERARSRPHTAQYARVILDRIERGEPLRTEISYHVQSFVFGDALAMVFMPGEVVADFALWLKTRFDVNRIWVNGYANDLPCYIVSRRILTEGGYEAETSTYSYDLPSRLAPEVEPRIQAALERVVPATFRSAAQPASKALSQSTGAAQVPVANEADSVAALLASACSPADSLARMTVRPGMRVELVAAEPLVADPIDVAWGPDGRMWVVEMGDYPEGVNGAAGGRVRWLIDRDGDGRYDESTTFVEGLNFPTSVAPWREGVLITAAPDILYAVDTTGDGRADRVERLYTGFGEGNQQHRVNGLVWGLDNHLHVANGDSDGEIRSLRNDAVLNVRGRDLRIDPDRGTLDAETGRAQYGRSRDDWGNWFGCNNSNPAWHYLLEDRYLRRNPFLVAPKGTVPVPEVPAAAPVYPTSTTVARFNDPEKANRFTSACSVMVYRDNLLGDRVAGNLFVCEPVHNLIHRQQLSRAGIHFHSRRADDEREIEFLASTDHWFRPTSVRTGPDGALYIVDMYRLVIEHPKWIPESWQQQLNLRAGHDRGRIYRVVAEQQPLRAVPRLDKLTTAGLVAALDAPNGWQRDMAHQMLLWKADRAAVAPLESLLRSTQQAATRLHALSVLAGLDALDQTHLLAALDDPAPQVRRHALRLSEPYLHRSAPLAERALRLVDDPDEQVQMQLACTLGQMPHDPRVAEALATLVVRHRENDYFLAAALSSLSAEYVTDVLARVLVEPAARDQPRLAQLLLGAARVLGDELLIEQSLAALATDPIEPWQIRWLAQAVTVVPTANRWLLSGQSAGWQSAAELARRWAIDPAAPMALRCDCLPLLGRQTAHRDADRQLLASLLAPRHAPELQQAALSALARLAPAELPALLLHGWQGYSPAMRSAVLDVLLSRAGGAAELLSAIESGLLRPAEIDAARRQRLLQSKDTALRARAETLLAGGLDADRQAVVDRYAEAMHLPADRSRGRELFRQKCAVCHRLENHGHAVGPDLAALKDTNHQALLVALLDPSRAVEDRYLNYLAELTDGRVLTGMLAAETGVSITLRGQQDKQDVVLRADLEALFSSGKSMMPEGLEQDLSPQAVADVIAYVQSAVGAR